MGGDTLDTGSLALPCDVFLISETSAMKLIRLPLDDGTIRGACSTTIPAELKSWYFREPPLSPEASRFPVAFSLREKPAFRWVDMNGALEHVE